MNGHAFSLAGAGLVALPSGALWWPAPRTLAVADLHLAKSARAARRSGAMLPPYETQDTLARLARDMAATRPARVICLGDSFDDAAGCGELDPADADTLARLQDGCDWRWVEGNHDCGGMAPGGTMTAEMLAPPLVFRHIASASARGEVSGHYHPKARVIGRGRMIARPCFLYDDVRLVLPAYGTYTGGLDWTAPPLRRLFPGPACAVLTGSTAVAVPVPVAERLDAIR
jgi:DNA ligase-associated metallophosphoesterase